MCEVFVKCFIELILLTLEVLFRFKTMNIEAKRPVIIKEKLILVELHS